MTIFEWCVFVREHGNDLTEQEMQEEPSPEGIAGEGHHEICQNPQLLGQTAAMAGQRETGESHATS